MRLLFALMLVAVGVGSPGLLPAQGKEGLPDSIRSLLLKEYASSAGDVRYFDAAVDLNGDQRNEVIVYLIGPKVCGSGGCSTFIFTPRNNEFRLLSTISITQLPIRVSSRMVKGLRPLIVGIGGGGLRSANSELQFNGHSYPSNPTVPPARRTADLTGTTILVPIFESFEKAKPLKP